MNGIVDNAINVETTVVKAPISSSAENFANKIDASVIVGIIDWIKITWITTAFTVINSTIKATVNGK